MFKVNKENCIKIGSCLAELSMRADAFSSLGPELEDKYTRACIFLYVSAICHQTETLEGILNGQPRRGWDYLMGKFIQKGTTNPSAITPRSIINIKTEDLQSIVSDVGVATQSTLSRVGERVNFLRDIGEILVNDCKSNPLRLYGNGVLSGKDGLYSRMAQFSAFGGDPIMKKATVYFMLMNKTGLWDSFKDAQELRPMPDYHKMRLFLRTGCVETENEDIDKNLKNKIHQDVSIDNELRKSTAEAYHIILEHSDKDFFELEVLLWSFARSLCYHSSLCISETGTGNFLEYVNAGNITTCPLEGVCKKELDYWHPIVDTHFH